MAERAGAAGNRSLAAAFHSFPVLAQVAERGLAASEDRLLAASFYSFTVLTKVAERGLAASEGRPLTPRSTDRDVVIV
jgi:hypothetical protein